MFQFSVLTWSWFCWFYRCTDKDLPSSRLCFYSDILDFWIKLRLLFVPFLLISSTLVCFVVHNAFLIQTWCWLIVFGRVLVHLLIFVVVVVFFICGVLFFFGLVLV